VPEAVRRIDTLESLGGECPAQVFFANPIDAMAGKGDRTLIDEQIGLI
jgi:hypothetical protein